MYNLSLFTIQRKWQCFAQQKTKLKPIKKANIVYVIQCPVCKKHYIGKTDRCFVTRIDERGSRHDQPTFQHLVNCQQFIEEFCILNLPISYINIPEIELNSHITNAEHHSSKILDYNNISSSYVFWRLFILKL